MQLTDDLAKLGELHAQGTLTDDEFATAKAKLIAGNHDAEPSVPAVDAQAVQSQLDALRKENELIRLDQAWELSKRNLMYRQLSQPTRLAAVSSMVVGFVIGFIPLVCAAQQFYLGGFGVLVGFGGAAIFFSGMFQYGRAKDHDDAEARYVEERKRLGGHDSIRK